MAQKIARLLNLFQPRPILTPEEVGPQFRDGHRLAYGWAFSSDDLMKYAEHYKLRQPLQKYLSGKLGKSFVTYGALSETEAQDADLHLYLTEAVVISVRRDLEERAGVKLLSVIPFSRAYHHLFALYTNVEVNRRMEEIEEAVGLEYVLDAIDDAIAGVGIQAEALWWYDSLTLRGVVRPPILSS